MDDSQERAEGRFWNDEGHISPVEVGSAQLFGYPHCWLGVWSPGVRWRGHAWCWLGSPPPSLTFYLVLPTVYRGPTSERRRDAWETGEGQYEFQFPGQEVDELTMARLRHRQPCRRGRGSNRSSGRGQASREHHHCCCHFCHRRAGVAPLQAEHVVEVSGANLEGPALPAFGSVVFTLGRLGAAQGISAHISVLFTSTPDAEGDGPPFAGDVPPADAPGPELPLPPPGPELPSPPPAFDPSSSAPAIRGSPSSSQAARARDAAKWAAMWEGIPEGLGWCEIVEEKSPAVEHPAPAHP